jgi:hypothetical protein
VWLLFGLQVSFERRKCDYVLRAACCAFRRNDVLERCYRQVSGANDDDRCMLAKAGVAVGKPSRCEAQIEGSVVGNQGHHCDLTECLGVGVERHATRSSFDAKPSTKFPQAISEVGQIGIVGRRADVNIDGGVAGIVETSRHTADDHKLNAVIDKDWQIAAA